MKTEPGRPALRYFGGKWLLAPWIIEHFPPHRVYVEPFGGGASVMLRKARAPVEVYNELDAEVVTFFRVLRDPAAASDLERRLRLTPYARGEFEAAKPDPSDDAVERARKLVVRSFQGFSSSDYQYRQPTSVGWRGPTSDAGTDTARVFANYPDHLPVLTARLRGVQIERGWALEVIEKYDAPDVLFYVDPPYVQSTRNYQGKETCSRSYAHELTDVDHRALAAELLQARGAVVLSGYDCPLYSELYSEWTRYQRQHKTNRNAQKVETLWLNTRASAGIAQGMIFK